MVMWAKRNPNENVRDDEESPGSNNLPPDGLWLSSIGGKSPRSRSLLPLRDITVSMRLADGGERMAAVGQTPVHVGGCDGDGTAGGVLSPFEEQGSDGAHKVLPNVRKKFWSSTTAWQSHSAPPSPSPSPRQQQQSVFRDNNLNSNNNNNNNRKPFLLTPCRPLQQPIGKAQPPLLLQPLRRSVDGNGEVYEGGPGTPGGRRDMKGLIGPGMKLDLGALQRNQDACEPTEMQLKRDKLAFFDKECSRVAEHVYLGSNLVAQNRVTLRENGITHVLNCVGFVCPEYFRDDLSYKTLWLQDSLSEDITSILYDVFDYFEEVREQGGRVFVHCCQGVSRSTSLVIAYLMWRDGCSFEDAFRDVKAARGVTNPNMGFACQLLQCQKRVHATPVSPNSALRMYRMAPHSAYDPLHLVPKTVNHPAASALDSRGTFVVHVPGALYVWRGSVCDSGMAAAAHAFTSQVVRYERAEDNSIQVFEGQEPAEFWEALRSEMMLPLSGHRDAQSGTVCPGVKQLPVYDTDYSLYQRAKDQAVMSAEAILGVMHGPLRDSGWTQLRRKFFCVPGSKSVREGEDGAGMSLGPLSTTGSSKNVGPEEGCCLAAMAAVGGSAASPNPSQCSSASSFSFHSFSSNSSHSPPFLASPCMSPPPSPSRSLSHSPSPDSALSLSPTSGESLSSRMMPFPSLDHFPSQLESGSFSRLSSKGPTLSLAQRRGGVSPSLCLPPSVKSGAAMTPRRLKAELAAISTGNPTGCNMLATVKIADTCCEFDAHNKVREEELPDDAMNNTAPQDVDDEEAVPVARRRPASFVVQEDVVITLETTTVVLKEAGGLEEARAAAPELYKWPQMEKIVMFMEDDLESHAAYVLVVPDTPSGRGGGRVYVWVGRALRSDGDGESPEEDDDIVHRTGEEQHWIMIGQDLVKQWQLRQDIPVKVVEEGDEPDEFWQYFING